MVAMLQQVGAVLIALAAIVAAVGFFGRLAPVRWLWRTLVVEPLDGAARRIIGDVIRDVVPQIVDDRLAQHPVTNGWGVRTLQQIGEATGADLDEPGPHPPESDSDTSQDDR